MTQDGGPITPWNMYPTFDIYSEGFATGEVAAGAATFCYSDYTDNNSPSPLTFTYIDAINSGQPECSIVAAVFCCEPTLPLNRKGWRASKKPTLPKPQPTPGHNPADKTKKPFTKRQ